MASVQYATVPVNGITTPSPEEDEDLYSQLLHLRDLVIAGKHASFKLSSTAIERLKASLIVPDAQARGSQQSFAHIAVNDSAFVTNQAQSQRAPSIASSSTLPGLLSSSILRPDAADDSYAGNRLPAAGIDPIFLQKSPELVRAETALKRARFNHDLQAQVDQRKHSSRDRDSGIEAPSPIDVDLVLLTALERVKHVSGLKENKESDDNSSFDENDYYSSQVQSDWSSDENSSKASDRATGAFTADFERLDGAAAASASSTVHQFTREEPLVPVQPASQPSKGRPHVYTFEPEDVYEIGDEDDEYTPPDAAAFDSFREGGTENDAGLMTPPDDDNSDYEPGEITDGFIPTPPQHQQPAQPSPRVPTHIKKNHLTHIAAPQPNRVSPLATAKGPSIELELVNGRPEVVQRPRIHSNNFNSRASTASPSGNGVGGSNKKRNNKKRKRNAEPPGRNKYAKKRRDKQQAVDTHVPVAYQEPYIKDEPVSPPPFANLPDVPPYGPAYAQQRPVHIESDSPRYAPQVQYVTDYPSSGLRYEHVQPASPGFVRIASPNTMRPVQRDTQDLRRVTSLHVAKRAPSPQQRVYSPVAPYRTASAAYTDHRFGQADAPSQNLIEPYYSEQTMQGSQPYVREVQSRSPPRPHEYRESYVPRAPSPAMMPPPAAPPRKVIVDQNGNRYYAAEPVPTPSAVPAARASVAPHERSSQPQTQYARAVTQPYSQLSPGQPESFGYADPQMSPPVQTTIRQSAVDQRISHPDLNGYYAQGYTSRAAEPARYSEVPTSPIYQQVRSYEQAAPRYPVAEPTSPVYVSQRSYSVRPEENHQVLRHASIAPVQYARGDAPTRAPVRAVSVMPGAVAPPQQHQRAFSQSSQAIRYVDQNGNEVFPREVRQVSDYRYS